MKGVVFDPDARAEFLAAIAYYEECGKGLGHRFRDTVENKLDHIRQTPLQYREVHPPYRICLVPKFPYAIIFSIEPDYILVLAVAHTKRKPGYWFERLEIHS